jgi:uncharacterized protein (TIGR02145 family)/uncharacterized repeat protein (TIGR02543 family)
MYAFAVSSVTANGESALSPVVTATPQAFTIVASVAGSGGSISPSGNVRVLGGANQTFTITVNPGYTIASVVVDGNADAGAKTSKQEVFSNVAAGHTVVVTFALKQFGITASILTDNGTVSGSITQTPLASLYDSGSTVVVTAPTDNNYTFTGWTGDNTGSTNQISIIMTGNKTLTAHYTIKKWTLTMTINPSAGGSVALTPSTGPYNNGTSVSLVATAKTGYQFASWSGDASGTNPSTSVMMNANKNVTATFTAIQYTITFATLSTDQGIVSQANPSTITVTAGATVVNLPKPPIKNDYDFSFWQAPDGSTFNANTPVNKSMTVTATWNQIFDGDQNTYHTVTIGNLTWLKENLITTTLNDGNTAITHATAATWPTNLTGSAYCWYNDDPTYKNDYGALYNWASASNPNIAPKGWHVATKDDWNNLTTVYSNTDALKEAGEVHWTFGNTGTNTSNFTALPGGWLSGGGGYYNLQGTGFWWTSTGIDATTAYGFYIDIYSTTIAEAPGDKTNGYSIRCVRNNP